VVVFAGLAAAIGAVFGLAVLNQYRVRRKPYQAAWGAALLMFGVAALCETIGLAAGWTAADYKAYYLFGALLNVGWLAVGEVYLLAPRRGGAAAAAVMAVLTLLSIVAVVTATTDPGRLEARFPDRASSVPAALPAVINGVGTLILVLGAAWSAWLAFRRRAAAGFVVGLVLIAAGALVVGGAHTIAVLFGTLAARPLSEAVGIAVMFAGYLAVEAGRIPLVQPRPA
jgi:hypothetical protein